MRRSRRQREEENPMIEAIKWWQRRVLKGIIIGVLPLSLLYAGFAWWIGTPAGEEFTGWTDVERHNEQRKESLENEMEKKYNEFTESTNKDVQNTIDNIQGTEDTSGAEYYNEDPYTAPEMQESVEQPEQQTNGANNSASETQESQQIEKKTTKESVDIQKDNRPEAVSDECKQIDNTYLGPTKGQLDGYDEWDKEDKEKYYSWDEQTRQAYEESIYRGG